jgi:hypothetical protein
VVQHVHLLAALLFAQRDDRAQILLRQEDDRLDDGFADFLVFDTSGSLAGFSTMTMCRRSSAPHTPRSAPW